jgi:3-deoxy-manno-octulosonate cytidylyltransferase (CMP-KDO synthetase)
LYFSRSPIPLYQGASERKVADTHGFYRHIGMYGYRTGILMEITGLKPSSLEIAESLEQNRWLENGYSIKVLETSLDTISVDTPEDLEKINNSW